MNADMKRRWVEALRSGKYTQAIRVLRKKRSDGHECHCAVGVFLDISDPDGWEVIPGGKFDDSDSYGVKRWTHAKEAGSPCDAPVFGLTAKEQINVTYWNDKGWTFPQIAQWIDIHISAEPEGVTA